MHIDELRESKYLTKDDCGKGILLTVQGVEKRNLAMEGEAPQIKAVLSFMEDVKPFVMNPTNAKLIADFMGSGTIEDWFGRKIVLFNNPTVMMRGKPVGGISARAPKNQPAPTQTPTKTDAPFVERQRMEAEDIHGRVPIPKAGEVFKDASRALTDKPNPFAEADGDDEIPF